NYMFNKIKLKMALARKPLTAPAVVHNLPPVPTQDLVSAIQRKSAPGTCPPAGGGFRRGPGGAGRQAGEDGWPVQTRPVQTREVPWLFRWRPGLLLRETWAASHRCR